MSDVKFIGLSGRHKILRSKVWNWSLFFCTKSIITQMGPLFTIISLNKHGIRIGVFCAVSP